MKKKWSSFVVPALLVIGFATTVAAPYRLTVEQFVTGYYNGFLERAPDPGGFKYWVNQLKSHANTGEGVALGFFWSREYQQKFANISNREFVKKLYVAMLGRQPDPGGWNNWVNHLNNGKPRVWVIRQFARSREFINRCNSANIIPFWGRPDPDPGPGR